MTSLLPTGNGGWTFDEMGNLSGHVAIVTGANSGIGYEAAKHLADRGCEVVMACRDESRANAARDDIAGSTSGPTPTVMSLDLADLDSITAFATEFTESYDELHVLANNAGVMAIPRRETADGFEQQFGVNHLGHFALTGLLLETLRKTPGETRVVTHSSGLHEQGEIDFEDLQGKRSYDKWDAYAQSKLANVLFAYELDRRLEAADASVRSLACHPGYADTNLQRRGPEMEGSRFRLWMMKVGNLILAQSAEQGALPLLYAATEPSVSGGSYIGPGGLMNMRGEPTEQRSSELSYDEEVAARLWRVSERQTGVEFDLPTP